MHLKTRLIMSRTSFPTQLRDRRSPNAVTGPERLRWRILSVRKRNDRRSWNSITTLRSSWTTSSRRCSTLGRFARSGCCTGGSIRVLHASRLTGLLKNSIPIYMYRMNLAVHACAQYSVDSSVAQAGASGRYAPGPQAVPRNRVAR